MGDDLGRVLAELCASEIDVYIATFGKDCIDVAIGRSTKGYREMAEVQTLAEAAEWFRQKAVEHFPESDYARLSAVGFV